MKRLTIIAALLLMAMPMMAERVTPETARKVATTFLNNNGLQLGDSITLKLGNALVEQYLYLGAVAVARDRYADEWVEQSFTTQTFLPASSGPSRRPCTAVICCRVTRRMEAMSSV